MPLRSTVSVLVVVLALAGASPAHAIFHGQTAAAQATPWLVSLVKGHAVCGGALIAPDRVLTAAHCVQNTDPAQVSVRIGGGNLQASRTVAWKGAFFPTNYREIPAPADPDDPALSATVNDVAVIVLTHPVSDIAPLALAGTPPADGEAAVTVGRGATGADDDRNIARVATQLVLNSSACTAMYTTMLLDPARHVCTQDDTPTHSHACAGDSGSPVMVTRNGTFQAVGVVTWGGETQGHGCGYGPADVAERTLPHHALLTGPAPTLAPYAHRRVRVHRTGRVRSCVAGRWTPASATLTIRWFRLGKPRTRRDPDTGATLPAPGHKTYLPGHTRTLAVPSGRIGCEVTARTPGGWSTADSYNQR
jgi:hypothetical protein